MPETAPERAKIATAAVDGKVFVHNPVTKETALQDPEQAAKNVFLGGWLPVSERDAEAIQGFKDLRATVDVPESIGLGVKRGLTLGLSDLAAESPEERTLLAAESGAHPIITGAAELGTMLVPLALSGGTGLGARAAAAAPVSLAARVGEGAALALRGESPGLAATALSRAAGAGIEGSIYGGAQAIRDAHLDDTPLTAQRLMSGVFGGFGLGAAMGLPFGAAEAGAQALGRGAGLAGEGLEAGANYLDRSVIGQRGAEIQPQLAEILKPGLSEADAIAVARAHGLAGDESALKGAVRDFQAANLNDPVVSRELFDLANAPGELGERMRAELFTEGQRLRDAAEGSLAQGLDQVHAMDQVALRGWSGRFKKQQIEEWVPETAFHDDAADAIANVAAVPLRDRAHVAEIVAREVERQVAFKSKEWGELLTALGADETNALNVIENGIATGDRRVAAALFGSGLGNNETMRALVEAAGVIPQWKRAALELIDNAGAAYEQAAALPKGAFAEGGQGKLKEVLGLLANERQGIAAGGRANAAASLDYIKKRLGSYAGEGFLGTGDGVEGLARLWHEQFRTALERPDLWGAQFAGIQRDINAILHKRIARDPAFHGAFFDSTYAPDPRNPWAVGERASLGKIRAAVDKFQDPASAVELDALRAHLAESKKLAGLVKQFYDLTPEDLRVVEGINGAVGNSERALTEAMHYARRVEQGQALRKIGIAGSGYRERGLLGYLVGGPIGAAAGVAFSHLVNPGHGLALRAVLERAWGAHGARVSAALSKMFRSGAEGLREAGPKIAAGGTALARRAGAPGVLAQATGANVEQRNAQYRQTLNDLNEMATQRGKVLAAIGATLGPGLRMAPAVPMHMADAIQRAAQTLLQLAPAKPVPSLFGGAEYRLVSDTELEHWNRLVNSALDPTSILDSVSQGTLTPDMVVVAEQAAPELVADLKQQVVAYVSEVGQDKLPYTSKVQLSTLFNVPLDMTMQPAYIQAQQMVHQARAMMQQQTGPTPAERRSFGEDGVQRDYARNTMGAGDRVESNEVIR